MTTICTEAADEPLLLSVMSGALYGVLKPEGVPPTPAGLAFGAGFMGLAWGVAGPALRFTPPPTQDTAANHVQHVVVHALFGLATTWVADRVQRGTASREFVPRRTPERR